MDLLAILLAFTTLLATAFAQTAVNTSQEYNLRTCLKPGQPHKARFDNLWMYAYHTGAGMNDVTFAADLTNVSAKGYLSPVNLTSSGNNFQEFNLGNDFPWTMVMAENVNFYAAWEPVRINAGNGSTNSDYGIETGFFINSTGLQWTSSVGSAGSEGDAFGGWLVCNWWHEQPQLFFRISYYNTPSLFTPCSCADVYLMPEYI